MMRRLFLLVFIWTTCLFLRPVNAQWQLSAEDQAALESVFSIKRHGTVEQKQGSDQKTGAEDQGKSGSARRAPSVQSRTAAVQGKRGQHEEKQNNHAQPASKTIQQGGPASPSSVVQTPPRRVDEDRNSRQQSADVGPSKHSLESEAAPASHTQVKSRIPGADTLLGADSEESQGGHSRGRRRRELGSPRGPPTRDHDNLNSAASQSRQHTSSSTAPSGREKQEDTVRRGVNEGGVDDQVEHQELGSPPGLKFSSQENAAVPRLKRQVDDVSEEELMAAMLRGDGGSLSVFSTTSGSGSMMSSGLESSDAVVSGAAPSSGRNKPPTGTKGAAPSSGRKKPPTGTKAQQASNDRPDIRIVKQDVEDKRSPDIRIAKQDVEDKRRTKADPRNSVMKQRKSAFILRKVKCELYVQGLPRDPRMIELPVDCDQEDIQKIGGYRVCIRWEEFEVRKSQERTVMLDRPRPDNIERYDPIYFGACATEVARYLMVPDKHEGRGMKHYEIGDLALDPLHGVYLYLSVTNLHMVYRVAIHDSPDRGSLSRWKAIGGGPVHMLDFSGFNMPKGLCVTKGYDVLVADSANDRVVSWSYQSARQLSTSHEKGSYTGVPRGKLEAGLRGFMLQEPVQCALVHSRLDNSWRQMYVVEKNRYLLRYDGQLSSVRRSGSSAEVVAEVVEGLHSGGVVSEKQVLDGEHRGMVPYNAGNMNKGNAQQVDFHQHYDVTRLIPTIIREAPGLSIALLQYSIKHDKFGFTDLEEDADLDVVKCLRGFTASNYHLRMEQSQFVGRTGGIDGGSHRDYSHSDSEEEVEGYKNPKQLHQARQMGRPLAKNKAKAITDSLVRQCLEVRATTGVGVIYRQSNRLWNPQNGRYLTIPNDTQFFAISPRGEVFLNARTTVYNLFTGVPEFLS
ncbi:unnamed protein product [Amoebophrya sp. A25]|nr:unnamed protein product [Amoebophrya sp. A25]|eukprot:GSA25T00020966001.1